MEINLNFDEIRTRAIAQKLKNKIHDNQYATAKEIIEHYLNNEHYGILKAKTQSGKTGVIMAVINILNQYSSIICKLKIDKIIYLTGDNQDIKGQAEDDFRDLCFKYYFKNGENDKIGNMIFYKQSDLTHMSKKGIKVSLKNTLLFLDESHFGTTKEKNKVPQFLSINGIEYMRNQQDMVDNNTYVLSVSATSFKEQENDIEHSKFLVELKTDETYKGFEDFDRNGQIHSIDENVFSDPNVCYDFFMNNITPHLDEIKNKTGKNEYVIMRIKPKTKIDYETLLSKYYKVIYVTQDGKDKINYDSMWLPIYENCLTNNKYDGRYLLFLIKGSFKMGKRIEPLYKGYCGCVIDHSKDKNNVETTIQGLLGRMSGYLEEGNRENWYLTKFFISDIHYKMIRDYYKDYSIDKTPYLYPKIKQIWGNCTSIRQHIGVNPEAFKENGILKYDITDYFDNNLTEWVRFSKEKGVYGIGDLKELNEKIFTYFEDLNFLLNYIYMGSRRTKMDNSNNNSNRLFFMTDKPDGGDAYLKKEYIGKRCYKSLLYNENGKQYIEIRISFVDTYDEIIENTSKIKEIKTMSTKSDNI